MRFGHHLHIVISEKSCLAFVFYFIKFHGIAKV
jgi:hypothetical protein